MAPFNGLDPAIATAINANKQKGNRTTAKTNTTKSKTTKTKTYDDIVAGARARAQESINAAVKPVQAATTRAANSATGAGGGLAAALAPMADQIKAIYSNAATQQSSLGQGFSQGVRDVLGGYQADAAAQLAQQGLPMGNTTSGVGAGDVVYGLGGYMPSSTMLGQGANWQAQATLMPGYARMQGVQDANTIRAKGLEQQAEIRAKYPSLYYAALDAERSWKAKQFANYVAWAKANGQTSSKPPTYVSSDGTTYTIDANGNYIPTGKVSTKPPAPPKSGPGTPAGRAAAITKRNDDVTRQTQRVDAWLEKQLAKKKTVEKINLKTGKMVKTQVADPVKYRVAYNYVFNQLWMSLKRYGYTKAQIRKKTDEVLAARALNPEKQPAHDSPVGGLR